MLRVINLPECGAKIFSDVPEDFAQMCAEKSLAWLTFFCFTSFVDWKSGAVMETQTWERLMTWRVGGMDQGRHGR